MKTFTSAEKSLMAQLGKTTQQEMERFFERWKEASFEARANGIRTMQFDKFIEMNLIWKSAIKTLA